MKSILFIAPPAAGKGTLSDYLKENYNYQHISTGEILRDKIEMQDEEGKEIEKIINSGNLVEDKILFKLLKKTLKKESKQRPFILDGIPRTLDQAKHLDIMLQELNFSNYIALYLQIDEKILEKRVMGRLVCSNCEKNYNNNFEKFKPQKEDTCDSCFSPLIKRGDDELSSFKRRYEIFKENNKEIIDYYKEQNRLFILDNSNEEIEEILKELQRIVGAL